MSGARDPMTIRFRHVLPRDRIRGLMRESATIVSRVYFIASRRPSIDLHSRKRPRGSGRIDYGNLMNLRNNNTTFALLARESINLNTRLAPILHENAYNDYSRTDDYLMTRIKASYCM